MADIKLSDSELLKYAIKNGIIDAALVQQKIEMQKKKEILEKHPYKIWEGEDGKWRTYLPDAQKGRKLLKRSSKESLEDGIVSYWREQEENPTVKDIFYVWANGRLANKEISKATYDRYEVDFKRFFGDFGKKKIKSIEEIDIEDFLLQSIGKYNLTSKSFSNLRTLIYGIFKKAKKMKLISYSVTSVVSDIEFSKNSFRKVIKEDYQEVFMEDEEPKVKKYLMENQDILNLGLLLTFVTGLRVGELVSIPWSCVDGNIIKVRHTESRYLDQNGKNVYEVKEMPKTDAGVRDVLVPSDYVWILKKIKLLNPFGQYMMEKDGKRIHTYTVRKRIYFVCKKTGVYKKSPHKIRKTYGTILLDNNVDNVLIQQQMGHTDISCTEQHYHRNRRDSDKKTQILSEIPELRAN